MKIKNFGNKFSLIFKDSEGGDYCRAFSEFHDSEVYLHEDWDIYFYNQIEDGFNIYLSETAKAQPFHIEKYNVIWYCNNCTSIFSCEEYYPNFPEKCPDCEDNYE